MESEGHGCLATADATGAQATERFGKKEKERFPRVFRRDMWTAPYSLKKSYQAHTFKQQYKFPLITISKSHKIRPTTLTLCLQRPDPSHLLK